MTNASPSTSTSTDSSTPPPSWSRRTVLAGGAVVAGTAVGGTVLGHAAAAHGIATSRPAAPATHGHLKVPFYGPHQAGVLTAQQAHGAVIALNLKPGIGRPELIGLLKLWTDDAARLMSGRPPLGTVEGDMAAQTANLTITFGFGPSLFTKIGLPDACPASLRTMPAFKGDALLPAWDQSDLAIQVCSDDPASLAFAQRKLLRDSAQHCTVAWVQRGFTNARLTEPVGTTPRNLMGMRDGSANATDPAERDAVVWCGSDAPAWLRGGTQMVVRRIRIDLDRWDDIETATKEDAFGRRVATGAPLTGGSESDPIQRDARDKDGFAVTLPTAHAALAQPRIPTERMIRRAFNYDDGFLPTGAPDQGLVFIAFQADVERAFIAVNRRLAAADALNTWIRHVGSAVYAVPPGCEAGQWIGHTLFA